MTGGTAGAAVGPCPLPRLSLHRRGEVGSVRVSADCIRTRMEPISRHPERAAGASRNAGPPQQWGFLGPFWGHEFGASRAQQGALDHRHVQRFEAPRRSCGASALRGVFGAPETAPGSQGDVAQDYGGRSQTGGGISEVAEALTAANAALASNSRAEPGATGKLSNASRIPFSRVQRPPFCAISVLYLGSVPEYSPRFAARLVCCAVALSVPAFAVDPNRDAGWRRRRSSG